MARLSLSRSAMSNASMSFVTASMLPILRPLHTLSNRIGNPSTQLPFHQREHAISQGTEAQGMAAHNSAISPSRCVSRLRSI